MLCTSNARGAHILGTSSLRIVGDEQVTVEQILAMLDARHEIMRRVVDYAVEQGNYDIAHVATEKAALIHEFRTDIRRSRETTVNFEEESRRF